MAEYDDDDKDDCEDNEHSAKYNTLITTTKRKKIKRKLPRKGELAAKDEDNYGNFNGNDAAECVALRETK